MSLFLSAMAFASALLSAIALYAGSRHCRWVALRRLRGAGLWLGSALAVASLVLWMTVLGGGAGLCAMLACWMLALIVLPYLALPMRAQDDV